MCLRAPVRNTYIHCSHSPHLGLTLILRPVATHGPRLSCRRPEQSAMLIFTAEAVPIHTHTYTPRCPVRSASGAHCPMHATESKDVACYCCLFFKTSYNLKIWWPLGAFSQNSNHTRLILLKLVPSGTYPGEWVRHEST